jgi:hypothetical protein
VGTDGSGGRAEGGVGEGREIKAGTDVGVMSETVDEETAGELGETASSRARARGAACARPLSGGSGSADRDRPSASAYAERRGATPGRESYLPRKRGVSLNRAGCRRDAKARLTRALVPAGSSTPHSEVGGDLRLTLPLVRVRAEASADASPAPRAAGCRATSRARRALTRRSSSRIRETFLTSAVRWSRAQGALSRAEHRFPGRA